MTGSWYCGDKNLTFKFAVKTVSSRSYLGSRKVDKIQKTAVFNVNDVKFNITADFNEKDIPLQNVKLNWK